MTIKEARHRLAKAGMELGTVERRLTNSRRVTVYPIITPIGNTMEFQADELAGLIRDLARASNAC